MLPPSPSPSIGAHFLVTKTDPKSIFTPEDFSDQHRMMSQTAEKFVDQEILPRIEKMENHEEGLVVSLMQEAAKLGFLGIEIPENYGGSGLGKTSTSAVEEHFGKYAGFGIGCGVHTGIASHSIAYFGTDDQKQRYLPKLASGELIGAFALTEPGAGSDALSLKTKATLSADGKFYLLNGAKLWITNAGWAGLFIIFAKVDGKNITGFIVERNFEGVSLGKEENKLGLKGSSTRRVILDEVKVPLKNVLGEVGKGHYIAFNVLNMGRFKIGMSSMGAAKHSLKASLSYALERQQFGSPIAKFGLIQQKLAEMVVRIFVGESMVYRTARLIEESVDTGEMVQKITPPYPRGIEEFAIECSIVKVFCSEIQSFVTDEAIQIHGGFGYSEEFSAARAYRDARINRIFEGTNEINRLFMISNLLRRAERPSFSLSRAVEIAKDQFLNFNQSDVLQPADPIDYFLKNSKNLTLHLIGLALHKFGDQFLNQQEINGCLSDLLIDIYSMESARLRSLKHPSSTIMKDLTLVFVNDAANRIELRARQILTSVNDGDDLLKNLEQVHWFLNWNPIDTFSVRRRIAGLLCEAGSYTSLIVKK